jgi:hypothetical protein
MATSIKKLPWVAGKKTLWPFRLRWLPGYLLCGAGFLLCVVAFYPGYVSPDSIRQLNEGRAWSFTDWHPPLMGAVWGIVDRIIPGPAGMLLLHNAAFWGALGLFWRETYRRSVWLGLALVGFGFLPTTLALLSTIWKDVGLGVSLLLASALLYAARRTNSRGALLASLPLLFYGYGVRQNAAPAILPLALWTGFVACRVFPSLRKRAASHRSLPFILGLACLLSLTAAVLATTRILTRGRSSYILQTVLLHDLAAISKERGEALFPDYVLRDEEFSLEKVSALYQPYIATPIIPGRGSGLKLTEDPAEIAALRAKWLEVVPANKGVYLRHRWEAFKWATGYDVEHVCFPYLATSRQFGGYDLNDWRIHRFLRAVFWKLRDTFFFRGFVWLLLSFVLLCRALGGRLRDDLELVCVLSLSGFLYGVAYFFFTPSCDFRFFWWTALASLVSLCFTVSFEVERLRTRRAAAVKS